MRKLPPILLFILLALSQGCVSDNPQFNRIIQSLPTFMIQMGEVTVPAGGSAAYLDYCFAMAVDPQDEGIYCAGVTKSDLGELNGDQTRTNGDAYIVKFDRDKKLLWVRQFGEETFPGENILNESFTDIAFDSRGYVYASGRLANKAMIAKFGRKGDIIWRRVFTESKDCKKIVIKNERIFCAGYNSSFEYTHVYEIDQNGNIVWLRQTTGGTDFVSDIAMDAAGNLLVLGTTTASFNPSHNPAPNKYDVFVWKLTSSGTELWIDQFGTDAYEEYANAIALDKNGNIIIGGYFFGSGLPAPDSDFDPDILNPTSANSFVASFRDTGTGLALNWNFRTSRVSANYIESLVVTQNNEIVVGGTNAGNFFEPNSSGDFDAFVSRVDSSGRFLSARQFGAVSKGAGNNDGYELCSSLAVDPLGNILCGGHSNGNTNETNGGGSDIMIWRLKPDLSF